MSDSVKLINEELKNYNLSEIKAISEDYKAKFIELDDLKNRVGSLNINENSAFAEEEKTKKEKLESLVAKKEDNLYKLKLELEGKCTEIRNQLYEKVSKNQEEIKFNYDAYKKAQEDLTQTLDSLQQERQREILNVEKGGKSRFSSIDEVNTYYDNTARANLQESKGINEKLKELKEREKENLEAIKLLEDITEIRKYILKASTEQVKEQQPGPQQPGPQQPGPQQPGPQQPGPQQPGPQQSGSQQSGSAKSSSRPAKPLDNAELLRRAQIEAMTGEPYQPITEFDILRTPKGIWIGEEVFIDNKRLAKINKKDFPEEIKSSIKEGKLGKTQDTKILKALAIYAKENKDVDLQGIMSNYEELVANGKQDDDKNKIGYNIKAGISYLRPSVRKEIKEMKKLALATRGYTSFYGNALSRKIFERKVAKKDWKLQNKEVLVLNSGKEKTKSDIINGINDNIKQKSQENMKEKFDNTIKFRPITPSEVKQQEDINKAVEKMKNEKAKADEIARNVKSKIAEEDREDR